MLASFFKILFAASLTQNPLATRFFFMAGAMATWQQHRLATDERWGPPELGFGPRADGPTLNTLNLVRAPSISKFSKLRAPVRADTPTLNTLNLVWAPSISKFSKLRAPVNADTPTLKTLKLVGGRPV
jgi:hypothetical protein